MHELADSAVSLHLCMLHAVCAFVGGSTVLQFLCVFHSFVELVRFEVLTAVLLRITVF